jgi:hypothetical protein
MFPPEISLRGSQPGCETSPRIIRQLGGKRVPEIQYLQASTTEEQRQVEPGRYLREVRVGEYWRLDNVGSFDEFLASRRKAYYLMAIYEQLPLIYKVELEQVGWTKARELAKDVRREDQRFDCATRLHKARGLPMEEFKRGYRNT